MKKALSLIISLTMILCMFSGLNLTVSAADTSGGFEYEVFTTVRQESQAIAAVKRT